MLRSGILINSTIWSTMEVSMELAEDQSMAKTLTKKKLKAIVINPNSISLFELKRMHHLFSEYYEGHPFEVFKRDLLEKDDVIILKDQKTKEIQENNKTYHGIYSGDTVIANEYWGSPVLGITFLKYLWWNKIKNPIRPLYWFLISKGYKTYLIMANNFPVHYPRFESKTGEHHKKLMDTFYTLKFKGDYNIDKGLIIPSGETCHLKNEVSDIDNELLKIPRIKFFKDKNLDWQKGHELCCIAEMTIMMPFKYSLKKMIKGIFK